MTVRDDDHSWGVEARAGPRQGALWRSRLASTKRCQLVCAVVGPGRHGTMRAVAHASRGVNAYDSGYMARSTQDKAHVCAVLDIGGAAPARVCPWRVC
jgi:hypothetical protein